MANVLVEETSLSNIASAIRGKNGGTAVYKPGEMAAAINNLPTGGSSDNEDGLLENTLVNYENTTATKIRDNFFEDSATLVTATFTNVSRVGFNAFNRCYALTQVSLPNAVNMGDKCFQYCNQLSTVDVSNVSGIGQRTFRGCESLTSINLPKAEVLGLSAFSSCSNLAKADLGSCKRFYEGSQFQFCNKLTTLIIRTNTVCSMASQSAISNTPFTNTYGDQGYLYVPRVLVDEYKNATNWTVYADHIRAIEDYPDITGG